MSQPLKFLNPTVSQKTPTCLHQEFVICPRQGLSCSPNSITSHTFTWDKDAVGTLSFSTMETLNYFGGSVSLLWRLVLDETSYQDKLGRLFPIRGAWTRQVTSLSEFIGSKEDGGLESKEQTQYLESIRRVTV